MSTVHIKVNQDELNNIIDCLNKLKDEKFDFNKLSLQISKGFAIDSEKKLIELLSSVDQSLTNLIDETLNFVQQSKKSFLEFDESYAASLK